MNKTEADILKRLCGHTHILGPGSVSGTPARHYTCAQNQRELKAARKLEDLGLVRIRGRRIYWHLCGYRRGAEVPNRHPDRRD